VSGKTKSQQILNAFDFTHLQGIWMTSWQQLRERDELAMNEALSRATGT
jgi:hypothetical protein